MKYARAIPFVTFFLLALGQFPAFGAAPKAADDVFRFSVSLGDEEELDFNWTIDAGHYLYRDTLSATIDGRPLKLVTAQGYLKDDPNHGSTEVYYGSASAYIEAVPAKGVLLVTYQGCWENMLCYPPITKSIDLATLTVSEVEVDEQASSPSSSAFSEPPSFSVKRSSSAITEEAPSLDGSFLSVILPFFGLGLLLAFSPCTFPMLPILSAMLTRSVGQLSIGKTFALSTAYVLAMASAYATLGVSRHTSAETCRPSCKRRPRSHS